MIALIHIYCSTSLCYIYKSLLIHDIQVLIYRGSTNERLSGEGMAYDSYYNETDRVIGKGIAYVKPLDQNLPFRPIEIKFENNCCCIEVHNTSDSTVEFLHGQ